MAAEKLLADPFWNKKLDLSSQYRDTNKDGIISQADFSIVIDRYISIAKASPEKVELAKKQQNILMELMGMADPSTVISYDGHKQVTAKMAETPEQARKYMDRLFDVLDLDSNGVISLLNGRYTTSVMVYPQPMPRHHLLPWTLTRTE